MRSMRHAEMRIETQEAQLIVSWRDASRRQHDDWVEALRSIKGAAFDRSRQYWIVPPAQADRVFAEFPEASYSYDAICLVVEAQQRRHRTLYKNLIAGGITLEVSGDRVLARGVAATSVLQSYLDVRPDFVEFVRALAPEELAALSAAFAAPPQQAVQASPEELRQGQLFATALRNATANQYRTEAYARRPKKKTTRRKGSSDL